MNQILKSEDNTSLTLCKHLIMEGTRMSLQDSDSDEEIHRPTAPAQGNMCKQLIMEGTRTSLHDSDDETTQPLTGMIDAVYI